MNIFLRKWFKVLFSSVKQDENLIIKAFTEQQLKECL